VQPCSLTVRAWDGELTYSELQELSAGLADHLLHLGVSRGLPVPVCFEKSAWTIVVMLGILRVGATVVPIDASHPVGRIATVVYAVSANLMVALASSLGINSPRESSMVTSVLW
jgi:non-ribosomal peptide synthetase component F